MTTRSEREKCAAGLLYQPYAPDLVADRDITIKKVYDYNHLYPLERDKREAALRDLLGSVGQSPMIEQPLFCTYGYNVTVGDNFYMNINGKLMDSAKITIGNNVFIAPNVALITETHPQNAAERNANLEYAHPITIGNNVWICTNALILPGVTIGDNAIIGAGSVVTHDVPANTLVAGNPAKVLRQAEALDRH
ncbi:sugar O-acetyltransferase [Lacticaseibacillus absianus]|uniref:sugar O-acetyltransferase n=1 Tax=Lacticaseibacillus absianus TaxID=2729623 RepID=UPI0015C86052|nr:sugar O-acetyltransferase [Lacticaseibacillus absianus]